MSPSGTPTLTVERLRDLHEAGAVGLSLSLDGSTAELHDDFRGVPGVFRWTLDAWDAARALGMKVQINTTVARHDLRDLPDIVRLVAEPGAMLWSAFFLVPTGRGRTLGALTPGEVEDVLNFVYDMGLTPAKTTEAHHFRRVALQRQVLADRGDDHVAVLGLGPPAGGAGAVRHRSVAHPGSSSVAPGGTTRPPGRPCAAAGHRAAPCASPAVERGQLPVARDDFARICPIGWPPRPDGQARTRVPPLCLGRGLEVHPSSASAPGPIRCAAYQLPPPPPARRAIVARADRGPSPRPALLRLTN
ncbi:radical SAM protein [Streptomyces sp. TG1A-60]|uniref:radical SAM protein n=1 Tax=Streptomyces sp. TG1A-60 TaxID=3129111 RepID=UPI0030D0077B